MGIAILILAWVLGPAAVFAIIAWLSPERPLTPEEAREQAEAINRYLKRL